MEPTAEDVRMKNICSVYLAMCSLFYLYFSIYDDLFIVKF